MMEVEATGRLRRSGSRRRRTSGVELIEFSFTFLPFLVIVTALISISWGIFAKSALQYAVKVGVRQGITISTATSGVTNVTSMVKNIVQQNSFGFLTDTSLIHVHYYQPPATNSTGAAIDVSGCTPGDSTAPCTASLPGNSPGNIMVVSVDGYSLAPFIARIISWNRMDGSATSISVTSADLIEQIDPNAVAPIGTAP